MARAAQQAEATTVGGANAQWQRGWRDGGGVMEVARVAETTVMATRGNRGYEPTLEARVAEATVAVTEATGGGGNRGGDGDGEGGGAGAGDDGGDDRYVMDSEAMVVVAETARMAEATKVVTEAMVVATEAARVAEAMMMVTVV